MGSPPPTATVSSPATVNTDASATHRRRQYTAAGSGPTGSHTHSMYRSDYSMWMAGPSERRRRRAGTLAECSCRPRVRLVPGQRARPALAPPRHYPVGGARQRVHAPADAGRAGGADLAGVDGALAAPLGPRRRPARRRAARVGPARLPAARAAAARGGAGRRGAARRRRPGEPGGAGGAARRRLLHGTGRRGVRPRAALPRRRHERPPGGRAGRARCGRRRAGAGSRRPRRRRRPAPARRRRRRARVRRADGAGRGRVHGPNAPVRGVPGSVGVRVAARGGARTTPARDVPCRPSRGPTGRSAAA